MSDWILLESRSAEAQGNRMLKLKVMDRSLCLLLQVNATNATNKYQAVEDEVNDALFRVSPTESTVLIGVLTHILKWTQIRGRKKHIELRD